MQGEEKDPAAKGDGGELAWDVQLPFVKSLRAGGGHSVLLEAQHLHARDPACNPTDVSLLSRTNNIVSEGTRHLKMRGQHPTVRGKRHLRVRETRIFRVKKRGT